MIIVRFADDIVVGFEHETDARRFWEAMRKRLEEFSLSLHPDKTRLIEFGRHAVVRRAQRGLGKPETFKFLGFVFICGRSRKGKFARCGVAVRRTTSPGSGLQSWPMTSSRNPRSFIHGRAFALPSPPKVGAVCLNWARTDLCGGRRVTCVPTAILSRASARCPHLTHFCRRRMRKVAEQQLSCLCWAGDGDGSCAFQAFNSLANRLSGS